MGENMNYPDNPIDFIKQYSFSDKQRVYTNGSELISVFRVGQMIEHYMSDLTPQQIKDMQFCLREKSRECAELRRELQEMKNKKNDGWNSVEKYGLPKDEGVYDLTIINGLEEYVSVRWQFLSGTHLSGTQHYVDGVHYWADNYRGDPINEFLSERVIAWRKKPEPYRPERSDNHDGE